MHRVGRISLLPGYSSPKLRSTSLDSEDNPVGLVEVSRDSRLRPQLTFSLIDWSVEDGGGGLFGLIQLQPENAMSVITTAIRGNRCEKYLSIVHSSISRTVCLKEAGNFADCSIWVQTGCSGKRRRSA